MNGQEKDSPESTKIKEIQPVLVEPIKGSRLSCDPDEFASKIKEVREDPDSNVWDQIMEYIEGYFGAEQSIILSSIHNSDTIFPRMVCTAVKYWNDKQLIVLLLQMVKDFFESLSNSKETYDLLMSGKVEETFHWLINKKVVLATALLACFLDEEDTFSRVLEIFNISPFPGNYNNLEDVLLIVSSALTYAKRIETHSLELLHILNLIQNMKDFTHLESEIQKANRFLVKVGIVDAITEVLSYKDCDLLG